MTAAGWALMLLSCGTITTLAVYCFWRVLRLPAPGEELHAPLDIDTGDLDEER